MVGHGCPEKRRCGGTGFRRALGLRRKKISFRRVFLPLVAILLLPGLFQTAGWSLGSSTAHAVEATELRLRVAWGGSSRRWSGTIRLSDGKISQLQILGLAPDSPGSMSLDAEQREIRVAQRQGRVYDGVDFTVTAPLDARVTIELKPNDVPGDMTAEPLPAGVRADSEPRSVELVLEDLIGLDQLHEETIDDRDTRLIVRRVPGDRLRLNIVRPSLVFAPGEEVVVDVQPHVLHLDSGVSIRCKLQLFATRSSAELWSEERREQTDGTGELGPLDSFTIALPEEEGVYEIVASLYRRRLQVPFARSAPFLQRQVQLVVVDSRSQPTPADQWRGVTFDPANPSWWEWMSRLPGMSVIPLFSQGKPLGNGLETKLAVEGRTLIGLKSEGWQAYPLPIEERNLGLPHILEVEFPRQQTQTLGVGIVESNEASEIVALDSGVNVPDSEVSPAGEMRWHRLIFWPRTEAPMVLLSNHGSEVAAFGRIRIRSGPDRLPPARHAPFPAEQRLAAAYFARPVFPDTFSAPRQFDAARNSTLTDWLTFYEGGQRLTRYLQHVGYNAAVVCVMRDGSGLWPSEVVQPTPRYDDGVFSISAQDPQRKDVLEMLFRQFDREGLQFIPALHFSGTLPQLEALRLKLSESEDAGIDLVGPNGRTLRDVNPAFYNPLDPRVQKAMRAVVEELVWRYGHHPSFTGVAVQLGPDCYAQLPDELWGLDDRTMADFEADTGVQLEAGDGPRRFARRASLLRGQHRTEWLEWRAKKLAEFHRSLREPLAERKPDCRLWIAGADMFEAHHIQRQLQPRLLRPPPALDAALRLGLHPSLYQQPEIEFLRPQRYGPLTSLAEHAVNLTLRDDALTRLISDPDQDSNNHRTGALFFHEPQEFAIHELPTPFVTTSPRLQMFATISPSGFFNRRRFAHALATLDARSLLDGGFDLPLGQEDAIRDFLEVYRSLPPVPFRTVEADGAEQRQPVVLRAATVGRRTYVYAVNDSPWQVQLAVDFEHAGSLQLFGLGSGRQPSQRRLSPGLRWEATLRPYELRGVWLTAPDVQIADWKAEPDEKVAPLLRQKVRQVKASAFGVSRMPQLKSLSNPDFEETDKSGAIVDWESNQAMGVEVSLDKQYAESGATSLRLRSRGALASARSQPFPVPKTGRLYVLVRMRVDDPQQQPRLRVALDDGSRLLDSLEVGTGEHAPKLQTSWGSGFLFPFENILPDGRQVMLRFDLVGDGEVWIDHIEMFPLWFSQNERNELINRIGLADFDLDKGKLLSCQEFLDSYWTRLLLAVVPPDEQPAARMADSRAAIGSSASQETSPPLKDPPAENKPAGDHSTWDRMRKLVPSMRLPFQGEPK